MERELAFSTFLKLLELPDPQKAATLRGFRRGGGFNYWRPLQVLATEVASRRLGLTEIQSKVGTMAKGHQRKYNENALTCLLKWISRKKISLRSRPVKITESFGRSGLRVRLEPELAFSADGHNYVMHIWATNNPSLSDESLSMGLYFFRRAFRKTIKDDVQYLIFDCVKNRIFAEINLFDTADEMLAAQCALLDTIWHDLEKAERRRPADDRPGHRPEPPRI